MCAEKTRSGIRRRRRRRSRRASITSSVCQAAAGDGMQAKDGTRLKWNEVSGMTTKKRRPDERGRHDEYDGLRSLKQTVSKAVRAGQQYIDMRGRQSAPPPPPTIMHVSRPFRRRRTRYFRRSFGTSNRRRIAREGSRQAPFMVDERPLSSKWLRPRVVRRRDGEYHRPGDSAHWTGCD